MNKYLILGLIVSALLVAVPTYATVINFSTPVYITGATSATTSLVGVTPATSRTLVYDSFNEGPNQKVDVGYLLVAQVASTSLSSIGISISYSQNGQEYYSNNLASTTANGVTELNIAPTYSLTGNGTASTTRVALRIETPTRFTKITFSSLVATSTVWGMFLPVLTY